MRSTSALASSYVEKMCILGRRSSKVSLTIKSTSIGGLALLRMYIYNSNINGMRGNIGEGRGRAITWKKVKK
jgi:hypothetical protein